MTTCSHIIVMACLTLSKLSYQPVGQNVCAGAFHFQRQIGAVLIEVLIKFTLFYTLTTTSISSIDNCLTSLWETTQFLLY